MMPIIFSPIIGALVDRVDKIKGMITSDIIRGFLIATIPFLVKLHNIYLIYLVIFLSEIFTLFFVPAKDALIPNLVEKDKLLEANSFSFTVNQITMFVGLATGTVIIFTLNKIFANIPLLKDFVGPFTAVYIDAFTFFISAVILAFIVLPKKEKKVGSEHSRFLSDIKESFIYLIENKKIRWMIVSAGLSLVGLGTILVIGPDYARITLGIKQGFLPLLTVLSLGLITGAVAVGMINRYISRELIFALSLSVLAVSFFILSVISFYEIAVILSFIAGFSLGTLYVSVFTIMHEDIDENMRGRIFTTLEADIRLAIIISALVTGVVASFLGSIKFKLFITFTADRIILFSGGVVVLIGAIISYKFVAARMHLEHD